MERKPYKPKEYHGKRGTPEYNIWWAMKYRCENPNTKRWERYGGRGITYAERWKSFAAFYEDMGPRPSPNHSIDRIDNDGNYTQENCRWATVDEQQANRCNNRFLTFQGRRQTVAQWSKELGIHQHTLQERLTDGWTVEEALTLPASPNRKRSSPKLTFNGETKALPEWAKETGISLGTLRIRYKAGWSVEDMLTLPVAVNGHSTHKVGMITGERHHATKLTVEQVKELRRRFDNGESTRSLADDFGITIDMARGIGKRTTWRHLE